MIRLAEFVLRHRKLVMLFWLVMLVVGGFAAGRTADRLTVDFSLPGQPGYETEKQILDIYGNGGSNPPDHRGRDGAGGQHGRGPARRHHRDVSTTSRRPCRRPACSATPTPATTSSSPTTAARPTRWSTPSRS